MHRLTPADELAEIRAEMARLQAREAALRQVFLADPAQPATGRWTRVEVVQTQARVFDASLLPATIRNNPAYHRDRVVQTLHCLPLPMMPPPRPGWPIQRDAVH